MDENSKKNRISSTNFTLITLSIIVIIILGINPMIRHAKFNETEATIIEKKDYYYKDGSFAMRKYVVQYVIDEVTYTFDSTNRMIEYYDTILVKYNSKNPTEAIFKFDHTNEAYLIIGIGVLGFALLGSIREETHGKKFALYMIKYVSKGLIPILIATIFAFFAMSDYSFKLMNDMNPGAIYVLLAFLALCIITYLIISRKESKSENESKEEKDD